MWMLKISLSVAAFLLILKVVRTESGTLTEKLAYLTRAVVGKSVWSSRDGRDAHNLYYSAHRAACALIA